MKEVTVNEVVISIDDSVKNTEEMVNLSRAYGEIQDQFNARYSLEVSKEEECRAFNGTLYAILCKSNGCANKSEMEAKGLIKSYNHLAQMCKRAKVELFGAKIPVEKEWLEKMLDLLIKCEDATDLETLIEHAGSLQKTL
jgi:hypothetical protein